jgi:putative hydrolase of the HAD superfamily
MAVVFDFGGVLGVSPAGFIMALAEVAGSTPPVMADAVFGTHTDEPGNPWHAAERGELALDSDAFATAMTARFDARGARYDHHWFVSWIASSEVAPSVRIQALAADVKASGRPIGMLTNSIVEFRAVIERTVDVSMFDAVVDSCEVGMRKPTAAIYGLMADRLKLPAGECLLLDDLAANVAGAQAAGMAALHVTDHDAADMAVRALLGL